MSNDPSKFGFQRPQFGISRRNGTSKHHIDLKDPPNYFKNMNLSIFPRFSKNNQEAKKLSELDSTNFLPKLSTTMLKDEELKMQTYAPTPEGLNDMDNGTRNDIIELLEISKSNSLNPKNDFPVEVQHPQPIRKFDLAPDFCDWVSPPIFDLNKQVETKPIHDLQRSCSFQERKLSYNEGGKVNLYEKLKHDVKLKNESIPQVDMGASHKNEEIVNSKGFKSILLSKSMFERPILKAPRHMEFSLLRNNKASGSDLLLLDTELMPRSSYLRDHRHNTHTSNNHTTPLELFNSRVGMRESLKQSKSSEPNAKDILIQKDNVDFSKDASESQQEEALIERDLYMTDLEEKEQNSQTNDETEKVPIMDGYLENIHSVELQSKLDIEGQVLDYLKNKESTHRENQPSFECEFLETEIDQKLHECDVIEGLSSTTNKVVPEDMTVEISDVSTDLGTCFTANLVVNEALKPNPRIDQKDLSSDNNKEGHSQTTSDNDEIPHANITHQEFPVGPPSGFMETSKEENDFSDTPSANLISISDEVENLQSDEIKTSGLDETQQYQNVTSVDSVSHDAINQSQDCDSSSQQWVADSYTKLISNEVNIPSDIPHVSEEVVHLKNESTVKDKQSVEDVMPEKSEYLMTFDSVPESTPNNKTNAKSTNTGPPLLDNSDDNISLVEPKYEDYVNDTLELLETDNEMKLHSFTYNHNDPDKSITCVHSKKDKAESKSEELKPSPLPDIDKIGHLEIFSTALLTKESKGQIKNNKQDIIPSLYDERNEYLEDLFDIVDSVIYERTSSPKSANIKHIEISPIPSNNSTLNPDSPSSIPSINVSKSLSKAPNITRSTLHLDGSRIPDEKDLCLKKPHKPPLSSFRLEFPHPTLDLDLEPWIQSGMNVKTCTIPTPSLFFLHLIGCTTLAEKQESPSSKTKKRPLEIPSRSNGTRKIRKYEE